MKVKIRRQASADDKPYWETFEYNKEHLTTAAAVLDVLNYDDDMFNIEGNPSRRIRWECGCMQKMCGACAMVINNRPALACNYFVDTGKTEILIIEPLRKFTVISDLKVDRSCINDYLKNAEMYIGTRADTSEKEFNDQYQVAKCLKCGLCLEVCPNYVGPHGKFYGAILANESYLMHSSSENRKHEIKKEYKKHFARSCSKSLACRDICPMKIPTLSSIGYMNRK